MTSVLNLNDFKNEFQIVLKDVGQEMAPISDHVIEILSYSAPHHSEARGFVVAIAYWELCQSTRDVNTAYKLGWVFQILQTYLMMLDDLLDGDNSRYGQPTLSKIRKHDNSVSNDIILVYQAALCLLKKYFSHTAVYVELSDFLFKISKEFSLGQQLERQMTKLNDPNGDSYNMKNYKKVIEMSTKYSGFLGPLYFANIICPTENQILEWDKIDGVCMDLSLLFSIQNDIRDIFDERKEPQHRDIVLGKAKFPIIKAKEVSVEKWSTIFKFYGNDDPQKVETVIHLLGFLNIYEVCKSEAQKLECKVWKDILLMKKNNEKLSLALESLLVSYFGSDI